MIRGTVILLLRIYQSILSPLMPAACRFVPSCSRYAVQAVQGHGVVRGLLLAVKRLLRCRPGCPGGHDPVPPP